jgi:hypothetical protein
MKRTPGREFHDVALGETQLRDVFIRMIGTSVTANQSGIGQRRPLNKTATTCNALGTIADWEAWPIAAT